MLASVEFYLTELDDLSNLCQVDGQINVGEMQMTRSACQVNFDSRSKFGETGPKTLDFL